jgi:hypothetical protein
MTAAVKDAHGALDRLVDRAFGLGQEEPRRSRGLTTTPTTSRRDSCARELGCVPHVDLLAKCWPSSGYSGCAGGMGSLSKSTKREITKKYAREYAEPRGTRKPGLTCACGSGRYWVRTSDLLGVNEALYH